MAAWTVQTGPGPVLLPPGAAPQANARGETATLLLASNEAQDIDPAHWNAVFMSMTASTTAPPICTGTPWRGGALLSREAARADERGMAIRVPWPVVAAALEPRIAWSSAR